MSTRTERYQLAIDYLVKARDRLVVAQLALAGLETDVYKHPQELDGMHSVRDEMGGLRLVRSNLAIQLSAWESYHHFRSTR